MKNSMLCWLLACAPLVAEDDLFRERFADPATRTASLTELVPGTQAAYFHTALTQQLAGREVEYRQTLVVWKAATLRKNNPLPATGLDVLENRQLLLDYQKNPAASLTGLIRKLELDFSDTRPDAAAAASLPTRLDPELISAAAFEQVAAGNSPETAYSHFSGPRLYRELERVADFDADKIQWFLENLDRADLPGVVPLVAQAAALEQPLEFDKLPLLRKLTATQLEALLKLQPALRAQESFALAYLAKLRPGVETDFNREPLAHAAYLQRARDYAVTLPPVLNSLKAHVLFHHLRLQQAQGNFPKEDLLTYLALPRTQHALLKVQEEASAETVNPEADFTAVTACPPVHDDSMLVNSWLQHFLGQSDTAAEFSPFVAARPLAALHARARLLAGADPQRWAAGLEPAAFKQLQEEAALDFAPGLPGLLDATAAVALRLDLKNTPELLVRIYELDLPGHLARHGCEPDASTDLDGLVPHHTRRIRYSQQPILQHRETIDLPELAGPGAWLVDFTAGQVSARALIRKGQLNVYPEQTASGQSLCVFDEKGTPVPAASLSLGQENFVADAAGRIVIPDAPNSPVRSGQVLAGKLAAAISLAPRSEELALNARFHLDAEQLLADQEAKLHLRLRLTNHGQEIPLDRLTDPALVLKAELLGGITTERVIAENLTLTPVMEIPFQVPADLLRLTLTLRGSVTPTTGGEPVKLAQQETYTLHGDLTQARVGTGFFSPTAAGHRLEVRGRNGEPLAARAITLTCRRMDDADDENQIKFDVRTDENGRVELGKLEGIESLTARGGDIGEVVYHPAAPQISYPPLLQLPQQREIRLPLGRSPTKLNPVQTSLLEMVAGEPIRDHFEKISVVGSELVIRGLPAGDFQLEHEKNHVTIRVSGGVEQAGLLVSNTRILPSLIPASPAIITASAAAGELKIQLSGYSPETRLTVVGKRYRRAAALTLSGQLPFPPATPRNLALGFTANSFLTEMRLSDEMRYILDRRAARTFPGSLLPRPGLLLHRWTAADLVQNADIGRDQVAGILTPAPASAPTQPASEPADDRDSDAGNSPEVCDFLKSPAVVRFDLKPQADGSLTLPLADFPDCQFLEITASDAFAHDSVQLALPPSETPLRDRRLARPLDSQAHHLAARSATVLQKGAVVGIENLLDADWRAFTTLTEAHQFLYGIQPDERLRTLVFLTDWPTFPEEKKLALLAQHPCHELHLFLSRKDPAFFEKSVKPLLVGKPEPQFMDDFLLARDLTSYLRPYAWQRLNAAEKALLSQALPAAHETIRRELALRWTLEAPTPAVETALFTRTLRGNDLAGKDGRSRIVGATGRRLDQLESKTESGVEAPAADAASDPFATKEEPADLEDASVNTFKRKNAAPKPAPPLFPEQTKLWREANYFKNTLPSDESLIPLNRFWLDLAAWDGKGAFLSPHFNECHTSANAALMCLALLDLPFKAERPEVAVAGSSLRVTAREPLLLFYKDTRQTENVAKESPLLVRQTFSPLTEPFRTVNGQQVENPVTGDFRPGVAYAASLIVTNPTGIGRRIDVLAQIPAGAIPLQAKPATQSSSHSLPPYGVVTAELAFYFPAAGDFAVYPLHVCEDGQVLAHTQARTLRVSNTPSAQDAASWQVLASEGSDAEVLARLTTENLATIELKAIRWRLKDAAFFQSVSKLLRERLHFSPDVAAFGFLHRDLPAVREYLENSALIYQLGQWLDSPLLEIRPRTHLAWETLEFDPLVNPRAHRFGENPRLPHAVARQHYQARLDQLGWKPTLDATDLLDLTALLFLQDRTEEALAKFDLIDPAKLRGRLNYDYLHTLVLFQREDPVAAKTLAFQILPTLPPGLWRDRFQAVADQAAEVAELTDPNKTAKPLADPEAPQLDLALAADGKLVITHRALEQTKLRLFSVDLEVLFSKNPFLRGDGSAGGQPEIQPNESLEITLAKDQRETSVPLPASLDKGNLLVSAAVGGQQLLRILDSRALELRHTPETRTIQVFDTATSIPLTKTYVKVYAETHTGEILFHKDGYTDLRGKFDYLSHTGIDPVTIKRLAILVSHPEKGARSVIYDR